MAPRTLHELQALDAAEFERWLEQRLIDLHEGDVAARRRALDLSEFGVLPRETFLDGLVEVFERLDPTGKASFRSAIGKLLRHSRPRRFPTEGVEDLIFLAGLTDAHEALQAFDPVFGGGAWGEAAPELFYSAISVLKGLKRGLEAYSATQRLVASPNFPAQYAFDAFGVLIAGRPENWVADYLTLSPLLARVAANPALEVQSALTARYDSLAMELASTVNLVTLANGVAQLLSQDDALLHDSPVGTLMRSLASGQVLRVDKVGFVELQRDAKSCRIAELSRSAVVFVENIVGTRRPSSPRTLVSRNLLSASAP